MSGFPNPVGLHNVRMAAIRLRDIRLRARDLKTQITAARSELEELERQGQAQHEEILTNMRGMDVGPNGNFGSGERMVDAIIGLLSE